MLLSYFYIKGFNNFKHVLTHHVVSPQATFADIEILTFFR